MRWPKSTHSPTASATFRPPEDRTMKSPRSSPIGRQLRAYEEGWREEHDAALRFWDFQENLSVGIAIFQVIAQRNASWRQRVSQGLEPFRPEDNEEIAS